MTSNEAGLRMRPAPSPSRGSRQRAVRTALGALLLVSLPSWATTRTVDPAVDAITAASNHGPRPVEFRLCGDGVVDPGEQCDDGNNDSGDGCGPGCLFEECGNGVIDPGEECDDGNPYDGDGCSSHCLLEICGNGILDAGEECDDGNNDDGDGCASDCTVEEPVPALSSQGLWALIALFLTFSTLACRDSRARPPSIPPR